MRKHTKETFWNNINILSSDECWEWNGKIGTGEYAETSWHGKSIQCHRKAYELWYNTEIPSNLVACHKCDNPPCCNPNHIFIGTAQDNVNDREQKGRNKLPYSKGEDHGIHKLTEKEVLEIVRLYGTQNHTYDSLAYLYKVTFGNIRKIIKGQTWGWLTGINKS